MIDFLGKMSAVVFENEFLRRQFKEFYQDIIPNLNFCRSCGILKLQKMYFISKRMQNVSIDEM